MTTPADSADSHWLETHHSRWQVDKRRLERLLLSVGLQPVSFERIVVGQSNEVYAVDTEAGIAVVVRVAHRSYRFDVEAAVIEHVRSLGVPAPEVIAVEEWPTESGATGVMVPRRQAGQRLGDVLSRDQAAAGALLGDAGRWLSVVHQVRTNGFGDLDRHLTGEHRTYAAWFVDSLAGPPLDDIRAAVSADPSAAHLVEHAVDTIVKNRNFLDAQSACLAHGDWSPANILVDDGRVSGILDWEGAKGAPAANDFAWWASIAPEPTANVGLLLSGYGRDGSNDDGFNRMLRLAQLRILISMLSWAHSIGDRSGFTRARRRLERLIAED